MQDYALVIQIHLMKIVTEQETYGRSTLFWKLCKVTKLQPEGRGILSPTPDKYHEVNSI